MNRFGSGVLLGFMSTLIISETLIQNDYIDFDWLSVNEYKLKINLFQRVSYAVKSDQWRHQWREHKPSVRHKMELDHEFQCEIRLWGSLLLDFDWPLILSLKTLGFSSAQKVTITSLFQREPPRGVTNGDYYNLNQPVPRNRMSTASSTMSAADRHYINDDQMMSKPVSQFDKKVTKIHAYFQNDQNVNDLEKRMNGFHHIFTILEDGYKGKSWKSLKICPP